ncbi:MAG: hypothetical protein OSJ67_00635 [Clostridia bacterium]|nr:hypothetical protein [Clostridia bacterium]
MKKIKAYIKKNPYIVGTLAVILTSIILAIFVFSNAYSDLSKSIIYTFDYFKYLFGNGDVPTAPVGDITLWLPAMSETFAQKLKILGLMLISGESYSVFFGNLLAFVFNALMICSLIVPIILIGKVLLKQFYFKTNTKHGQETFPLRAYKKLSKYTITPITNYIKGTYSFIKADKAIKAILIAIWTLNLNVISIVLPFIPFYLSFCMGFNVILLYDYLRFILFNLRYAFGTALIVTLPILLVVFDKIRQQRAVARLNKFEEHNEKMVANRDISTYKWGFMGSGKTMSLTDEALSISVHDTKVANELKNTCRKMFPFFPWLLFEKDIESAVKKKEIYNWATAIDYVTNIEIEFNNGQGNLFGYDYKKFGMNYYNGIVTNHLFKVLVDYARLHYLYIFNGSFIISNYSIREDKVKETVGNTWRWNCDFFDFSKNIDTASYYSKILNFDLLRMGKKIKEDKSNDSLEFGIICITEADKEQMNAVETIADSVESAYANPKNDGMTRFEKYIRHRAEIMSYCFAHFLTDGQRVMSINADARELGTMEHISRSKKEKSTLSFFFIEKTIYNLYKKIYDKFDDDFCYYRGDESLIHYFMKWVDSKIYNLYYRRKNKYGYCVSTKEMEKGTLDGEETKIKMYLCNAKILADRYKTDSFSVFFQDKARASGTGMINYESYKSTTMSDSEFEQQNSYARLNMSGEKWKQPYIDQANKEKELKKLMLKEEAKEALKKEKSKSKPTE